MSAKQELLSRLRLLTQALKQDVVKDKPPTQRNAQLISETLRQGCAVLAFSALEDFFRARSAEALLSLDSNALIFSALPPELQRAAILDAIEGIRFRKQFEPKTSRVQWTLDQLRDVVTAAHRDLKFSKYSFFNSTSNIQERELDSFLKCFGIENGWQSIDKIAKHSGIGGPPDLKHAFIEIKNRRHLSAHGFGQSFANAELRTSIIQIFGIALGFDTLLSNSIELFNIGIIPGVNWEMIDHQYLDFIFIQKNINSLAWEVFSIPWTAPNSVVVKLQIGSHGSRSKAMHHAQKEAITGHRQIIVRNDAGIPMDWQY